MGVPRKAVEMPTEKTSGDGIINTLNEPNSPGRGPRDDGTSKVPDRQLSIRKR
jgi:hypothetical protein